MAKLDLTLTLNSENELEYMDISEHPLYGGCQKKTNCVFVEYLPNTKVNVTDVLYVYVSKSSDVIEKDWLQEFNASIGKIRRQISSTFSSLNSTF